VSNKTFRLVFYHCIHRNRYKQGTIKKAGKTVQQKESAGVIQEMDDHK